MKHVLFITCIVLIQLFNLALGAKPIEVEHEVTIKDYGVEGINKTVSLHLMHGLHPGSFIIIVSQTDRRGTINICDENYNNLIHMDTRLLQDRVILNSYLNKTWGSSNVQLKPPIEKGAQSVTTILYEEAGYRIFVNGKEVAFYKHRSDKLPQHLIAFNNKIFKIIYLATRELNGDIPVNCSQKKDNETL